LCLQKQKRKKKKEKKKKKKKKKNKKFIMLSKPTRSTESLPLWRAGRVS